MNENKTINITLRFVIGRTTACTVTCCLLRATTQTATYLETSCVMQVIRELVSY